MDATLLEAAIDELRRKLVALFHQVGNFSDKRVVALSQELDGYLVDYQRIAVKKYCRDTAPAER